MTNVTSSRLDRRHFLSALTGAGALAAGTPIARAATPRPGRLKQAVCRSVLKDAKLGQPICKAIADLDYQGYLAHEYTPTKDALPTLEKMLKPCKG